MGGRKFTAAFVAMSMLGSSAASAAVAAPAPVQHVDPLAVIAIFGTAQSRATVCAGGASAAVAAGAAVAAQPAGPGCVLPAVDAPPPVAAAEAPPPAVAPVVATGGGVGVLPLLLGLAAIAAIAAVVLKHEDTSGEINLPVSP